MHIDQLKDRKTTYEKKLDQRSTEIRELTDGTVQIQQMADGKWINAAPGLIAEYEADIAMYLDVIHMLDERIAAGGADGSGI